MLQSYVMESHARAHSHPLAVFCWLESIHGHARVQGEGFAQEARVMGATVGSSSLPPHPQPTHLYLKEETNFHTPLRRNASHTESLWSGHRVPNCTRHAGAESTSLGICGPEDVQGSRFKQGGEDVFLRFLLIPLFFLPFVHQHVHSSYHVPSAGVRNRRNMTGACSLELCFSVEYLYF